MTSLAHATGDTPLQPLPATFSHPQGQAQAPPPIDYYAADRASHYHHQEQQKLAAASSIPIDFYVADRTGPPYINMAAPPQGGPPPYQGGQWQHQQHQQPYPQQQPQGTPIACLGPHPAPVVCPNCRHSGVTAVEYSSGGFTHALGALLCFITCLGCIPYFFSGLKDATHKCANVSHPPTYLPCLGPSWKKRKKND